jgi:2,3-bisphosphoglycerate-independent phosphoglycerate mutase
MQLEKTRPVVLIIIDGWGIGTPYNGNAISLAKTPVIRRLSAVYPHSVLSASGESVGLPHGEAGNSEVGHLNIGAGRIVYQDLPRINMSIADGTFGKNPVFFEAINHCLQHKSNLHLMGLAGTGSVHSSINHLYALLWLLKENNFKNPIFLHLFTDGRDSPPTSAPIYISEIENKLKSLGLGKIASISGRYYAMDRDNRWDRTQLAYQAMVEEKGEIANSALEAVEKAKLRNETDEFIKPTIILDDNQQVGKISDNDAVIFYNYRTDRPRQLVKAFVLPNFESIVPKKMIYDPNKDKYIIAMEEENDKTVSQTFKRNKILNNLFFVTMSQYEKGLPVNVAFPQQVVKFPLAAIISSMDLKQLHISETEKYAHVTYFFNGGREDPFPGEDRIHIPSPKIATYDLKPAMSAREITSVILQRIESNIYDFIVINFANPDMVGHSGNIQATIKACECVDECIGLIVSRVLNKKGSVIITADHGNAEEMINIHSGDVDTYHTSNPVPIILCHKVFENKPQYFTSGILADVAPTVLKFLGLPVVGEMSGRVLI